MIKGINKQQFLEYQTIFGSKKMEQLWLEFDQSTQKSIDTIENQTLEDIRQCFHTLRSSSLVFGLEAFSHICEEIEESVLNNKPIDIVKKDIDKAKKIFYNQRQEIQYFFEELP